MTASDRDSTIASEIGSSQPTRVPPALDPAFAPIDGRSAEALARFARTFASGLAYHGLDDTFDSRIDWASFLPDLDALSESERKEFARTRPPAALFLAFLRLYAVAQKDLDALTERHLDFYYREVLRLKERGPLPDRAHLLLGLKKTASELRIPRGTAFVTKDKTRFVATDEVFVHHATITFLRTLHRDPGSNALRYAAEAQSGDGLGGELPESDPSFHPFGYARDLPLATTGFAVSGPVLVLREGTRTITLTLGLRFTTVSPPEDAAVEAFFVEHARVLLSGAEDWIGPLALTSASVAKVAVTSTEVTESSDARTVTLVCEVPAEEPPVVPYDPTVLPGGFDTLAPVMKVTFEGDASPELAAALASAEVTSLKVKVAVTEMRDVTLESDAGKINPKKPFYPFGPLPKQGTSFYIGAEEALAKKVTAAKLHIRWNAPPTRFDEHYAGYTDRAGKSVTSNGYFKAALELLKDGSFVPLGNARALFHATDATRTITIDSAEPVLAATSQTYSKFAQRIGKSVQSAKVRLPFSDVVVKRPLGAVRTPPALALRSKLMRPTPIARVGLAASTREGFLRLRLVTDFLHDRYPELFASAFSQNNASPPPDPPAKVPSPPYTPEIAEFTLDYEAESATVNPASAAAADFEARELRLFQVTPFGQREEHRYIKEQVGAADRRVMLLPDRSAEGELLIGLSGVTAKQSVSLLFQMLEGSADPTATHPTVRFSVLASNHWHELEQSEILADTTNGLLTSGIVRVLLPAEVTDTNTLLEPGTVWLRATVDTESRGVSRVLAIVPNAVPVEREDVTAAPDLVGALPDGSISAAATPLSGLKEVTQPYASFGGALPEDASRFRRRVSERLRHRARAVTPWDYERLVLEHFPNVFRARCLPHTGPDLESRPGHVALVVVADTRNTAASGALEPRVDLDTLEKIDALLASVNAPFAEAHARNPSFERVQLEFKVAFRSGLPYASYRVILIEALKRHLAPWAYDASLVPEFGHTVLRSGLIAFVENLEYVDYVTDFRLLHHRSPDAPPEAVHTATPSSDGAILTSAETHLVEDARS